MSKVFHQVQSIQVGFDCLNDVRAAIAHQTRTVTVSQWYYSPLRKRVVPGWNPDRIKKTIIINLRISKAVITTVDQKVARSF